jgi:hypothetical protein
MLAPCVLNFHFYIFVHGSCAKQNHKYQYQDKKSLNDYCIHTYTHQTSQQHTFHGKPTPKCNKTNIKNARFLNFT